MTLLAAIAADCIVQHYAEGELVIGHTDTSFDVLLLMSGTARVSLYSADGQRVGFREMPKGMMFGEISAIDGLPRSASVEASEPCMIATLPRKRFLALIEEHPGFAIAVARQLAGHVRRLTTRVFEFSTMAVRQRLRAELLRLAGPPADGGRLLPSSRTCRPMPSLPAASAPTARRSRARWHGLTPSGHTVKQGRNLFIPSVEPAAQPGGRKLGRLTGFFCSLVTITHRADRGVRHSLPATGAAFSRRNVRHGGGAHGQPLHDRSGGSPHASRPRPADHAPGHGRGIPSAGPGAETRADAAVLEQMDPRLRDDIGAEVWTCRWQGNGLSRLNPMVVAVNLYTIPARGR